MSQNITDMTETTHPSKLSDDERKTLYASIESEEADEIDAGDGDGDGDAGAAASATGDDKAGKTADAEADGAASEGRAADDGGKGKGGKSAMIPKPRLDEVLEQNRILKSELDAIKAGTNFAKLAESAAGRDFAKEEQDLQALYDDGEITLAEFTKRSLALTKEQTKLEVMAELAKNAQSGQQDAQQAALAQSQAEWQEKYTAWQSDNADFLKNPARAVIVQSTIEMMNRMAEYQNVGHDDFLAALNQNLAEAFPSDFKAKAATSPANQRRADATRAAAAASTAPPPFNGGVGNRGANPTNVDIETLRLGQFGKLPKDVQNKMLGLED